MGLYDEKKLRPGYVQEEGSLPHEVNESDGARALRLAYEAGLEARWSGDSSGVERFEDEDLRAAFMRGFRGKAAE